MQKPATGTATFGFQLIAVVENDDIWINLIAVVHNDGCNLTNSNAVVPNDGNWIDLSDRARAFFPSSPPSAFFSHSSAAAPSAPVAPSCSTAHAPVVACSSFSSPDSSKAFRMLRRVLLFYEITSPLEIFIVSYSANSCHW